MPWRGQRFPPIVVGRYGPPGDRIGALAVAAGTVCSRPTDQPTSRTSARSPVSIARTGRSWGGAVVTGRLDVLAPPGE